MEKYEAGLDHPDYKLSIEGFEYKDFIAIDVQGQGYVVRKIDEDDGVVVVATGLNLAWPEAVAFAQEILRRAEGKV